MLAEKTRPAGLAPRQAAAVILAEVLDRGRPLDAVLDAADSPLHGLAAQDRSLARALVSTALRRHGQIDAALATVIERRLPARTGPLPRILEIAATQLLFMGVPDHAAVSLAVQAADADQKAKHFKPLANGALRNLVRRRDEILAAQDAPRLNTPDWLWERWTETYGDAGARAIAEAHLAEPPLDLTAKADPAAWAEKLGGVVLPTGTIRVMAKGRVESLPGYDAGVWWVQDAAAAVPARLLGDVAGKDVLDLCAAPGGKTAQLAAAGAKVTAVDISAPRVDRMKANLRRLGLDAEAVVADVLTYEPGRTVDAVLLDAPCSATGTIRRHPDIAWLKKPGGIRSLADLQRGLLAKAAQLVRPGGILVYAVCSLEPEEGPALADLASGLGLEEFPIGPGAFPGLAAEWVAGGRLRTLPHQGPAGGMDGFFAARFRRR